MVSLLARNLLLRLNKPTTCPVTRRTISFLQKERAAATNRHCAKAILSFHCSTGSGPSSCQTLSPRTDGAEPLRHFSSEAASFESCPFETLGVPKTSTYENVKQAFLKLAELHHPDKTPLFSSNAHGEYGDAQEEDEEKDKRQEEEWRMEKFNLIRGAFESLAQSEDGLAILRDDVENEIQKGRARIMTPEELDEWFHSQTGLRLPPYTPDLDPCIARDIAKRLNKDGSLGCSEEGEWWLAWLARQGTREEPLPLVGVGGVSWWNIAGSGYRRKVHHKNNKS